MMIMIMTMNINDNDGVGGGGGSAGGGGGGGGGDNAFLSMILLGNDAQISHSLATSHDLKIGQRLFDALHI